MIFGWPDFRETPCRCEISFCVVASGSVTFPTASRGITRDRDNSRNRADEAMSPFLSKNANPTHTHTHTHMQGDSGDTRHTARLRRDSPLLGNRAKSVGRPGPWHQSLDRESRRVSRQVPRPIAQRALSKGKERKKRPAIFRRDFRNAKRDRPSNPVTSFSARARRQPCQGELLIRRYRRHFFFFFFFFFFLAFLLLTWRRTRHSLLISTENERASGTHASVLCISTGVWASGREINAILCHFTGVLTFRNVARLRMSVFSLMWKI